VSSYRSGIEEEGSNGGIHDVVYGRRVTHFQSTFLSTRSVKTRIHADPMSGSWRVISESVFDEIQLPCDNNVQLAIPKYPALVSTLQRLIDAQQKLFSTEKHCAERRLSLSSHLSRHFGQNQQPRWI